MPAAIGIIAPFVLSLTVCILLAGRKLSLVRLSISVVASQTLFHTLFVLGTPGSTPGPQNVSAGHHHGHEMMQMPVISDHTVTLMHGDTIMWLSHLVGAIVTIMFLYRGEQAIHRLRAIGERLVAWMRHGLTTPIHLPVLTRPARLRPVEVAGWTVLSQIYASTLSRRGPPVGGQSAR